MTRIPFQPSGYTDGTYNRERISEVQMQGRDKG
jgi:hypothetical protein